MIPRSAITHWNKQVPWEDIANVEQDLIITRALTDIFADEFLSKELAFRGGTALTDGKDSIVIHPLYTESPLESFAGLRVPMAEKVMVDIAVNPEFDYLQGSEVFTIYENAFRSCSVSRSALLRYARRRRSLDTIQKILSNIDLPENW